jgi:hypothetical protein
MNKLENTQNSRLDLWKFKSVVLSFITNVYKIGISKGA